MDKNEKTQKHGNKTHKNRFFIKIINTIKEFLKTEKESFKKIKILELLSPRNMPPHSSPLRYLNMEQSEEETQQHVF